MLDSAAASQVGSDDSNVWYSPSPGTYFVLRINAVEMVRHLEDDDALEAVRLMKTKSYLICLNLELDLPFPDKPWYRFEAFPIGPHLPPSRKAEGYTPDMCIPIFPNSKHPTGREPVHPERPFPYGNCYHWINTKIRIRVRARPEGFDESNAVNISGKTELLMGSMFRKDYLRAMDNVKLAQKAHETELSDDQPRSSSAHVHGHPLSPPHIYVQPNGLPEESTQCPQEGSVDAASMSSGWSRSNESTRGPMTSVEDIMHMDIFTGPDEDLDLVPLVDLWPDLADNLKEEDIASPLELHREIEQVQR
ncbi:uncharacterized protein TRAVEDRAFT_132466 [Trametes versicolor FP-101664 SS1]|uniref:uncharacterized protein n=1 Tax=Trametes versicolor (strain FP-101664) TaxID=717944 RepID=UPI0004623C8F|nr:uncharacterized protein TRAVEDRAFT_132466 [Trametes versicolor FP-101664 SS1]EIW54312.1 hypothetical protein TRAVEDRAFT_132466 [Trametes versicolor FP-101664 SS1]